MGLTLRKDEIRFAEDVNGEPVCYHLRHQPTHIHVGGASGTGKSSKIISDTREFTRVRIPYTLADPHGPLYVSVAEDWAHGVQPKTILINLSELQDLVINCNLFQRSEDCDLLVQTDRRLDAVMHAWGVRNMDETPTLARVLRLVIALMLETDLTLPQISYLFSFESRKIRDYLINQIQTPLVQREWRELQALRASEWRDEVLSTKNRLFRFLTSTTLARVMGTKGRALDLHSVLEKGICLGINAAPSNHLSREASHAFLALLLTAFHEAAMARKPHPVTGLPPRPYFLILDEFEHFLSPTMASALDELRKYGLFLYLSHQRLGQLDPNTLNAVLTNCGIKAVFGGLPAVESRVMAEELFLNQLDPRKIKLEVRQTGFRPVYARDKTFTRSSSSGFSTSHSVTEGAESGFSSGDALSRGTSTIYSYSDEGWRERRGLTSSDGHSSSRGFSTSSSQGITAGETRSHSETVSESDIPIILSEPFEQLSSVQYYSVDEQLTQFAAAIKFQPRRQFALLLPNQDARFVKAPYVKNHFVSKKNRRTYEHRALERHGGLPVPTIDAMLKAQDDELFRLADASEADASAPLDPDEPPTKPLSKALSPIWNRGLSSAPNNPGIAKARRPR